MYIDILVYKRLPDYLIFKFPTIVSIVTNIDGTKIYLRANPKMIPISGFLKVVFVSLHEQSSFGWYSIMNHKTHQNPNIQISNLLVKTMSFQPPIKLGMLTIDPTKKCIFFWGKYLFVAPWSPRVFTT